MTGSTGTLVEIGNKNLLYVERRLLARWSGRPHVLPVIEKELDSKYGSCRACNPCLPAYTLTKSAGETTLI